MSATVYVKEGDSWKAAYHNEVPIVEPKAAKVDEKKPAPPPAKYEPAPASNVNTPANTGAKPAANTSANASTAAKPANLTAELTAVEKSGWEAWKAKDAKKFDEILAKDITFVDHNGMMTAGKDAVIKLWTDPSCEVKSVDVTDSNATEITPGVAILTYKGKASGTCGGSPVTDLWGTTVSMKDGDTWKAVYIFETPMAK
jgi:ketosteroid isomerase-like protein